MPAVAGEQGCDAMTDVAGQPAEHKQPTRKKWVRVAVPVLAVGLVVTATVVWRYGGKEAGALFGVEPGTASGWNVLLVSIDTVRADRLGCYGYAGAATPTLDALAAGGVRCAWAIAPMPLTLPSHSSLLTGLDPHHHGARANGVFRLDDDVSTLAELLGQRGYRTGAVISAYVLDRRYGLAQGFEEYGDDLTEGHRPEKFGYRERTAAQANRPAVQWLREHRHEQFFLWVHYFDPHAPYEPPEPYRTRFADRSYDGEIAYADEQLGRLLAALDDVGVRDRTLVVVVSDHGESLGEHRELTHGMMIYDATLRVPVILEAGGVLPSGLVIDRQVGLIDVMPTVLDLLGEEIPPNLDGVSLLRSASAAPRELYIETLATKVQYGWSPLLGVRRDDVKFIFAPTPELYDLRADPKELNNLLPARRELAGKLLDSLRALVGGDPELAGAVTGNLPLDRASREKLAQLGYVFSTDGSTTTQRALPDPKDMIDEWLALQRAQTLADRGEHAKTIARLEPLVRARPGNCEAQKTLALSYAALGQLDPALAAFRRVVKLSPHKAGARVDIGKILLEMGKVAEAETELRRALAEDPTSPGAMFGLGAVLARQNRPDEALRQFEACVEVGRGSNTAGAHFNVGSIHYAAGRLQEAREAFERSLAANPGFARAARALAEMMRQEGKRQQAIDLLTRTMDKRVDPEALVALGKLHAEVGHARQAVDALKRSIELRPDLSAAHYELAMVLQQLGRADESLSHLQACLRLNPSDAASHLQIGVTLAGRDRLAEAETHLRQAVKLAPNWAGGHYNLAVALAKRDRLDEAVASLRRAIEINPRYATAHHALGELLSRLGRSAEAEKSYRRAAELDPKFSPTTTSASQSATR